MKGTLTVTENALASLLGLAAHEVPGVVGMAPSNLKEGLQKILGRAQASDGVVVAGEASARTVDVNIVVAFGTNISTVGYGSFSASAQVAAVRTRLDSQCAPSQPEYRKRRHTGAG